MKFFNEPHLQDHSKKEKQEFVFKKDNYKWMFIGIGFIALGYILMVGGASDDPNVFNPEIYNWRRIRLAPALVLIGLGLQIYAILYKPKEVVDTLESEPVHTSTKNVNTARHKKGKRQ